MRIRRLALSGLWICCALSAYAGADELSGSLVGQVVFPTEQFRENTSVASGGLGLQGGYRFGDTPIYLGGEFNVTYMGTDSRTVAWSSTIPDLKVDVETQHAMAQVLLVNRLIAPSGVFRPYVEALGGLNLFSSVTSVNDRGDGDEVASDDTHNSAAWTYGAGAGVLYRLFEGHEPSEDSEESNIRDGYLVASLRYFSGTEAEYMTAGSVTQDENNDVKYDKKTSPIEHWTFSIGFQGTF